MKIIVPLLVMLLLLLICTIILMFGVHVLRQPHGEMDLEFIAGSFLILFGGNLGSNVCDAAYDIIKNRKEWESE